jgi:hypothetical protein
MVGFAQFTGTEIGAMTPFQLLKLKAAADLKQEWEQEALNNVRS